jgi:hypothetical protein
MDPDPAIFVIDLQDASKKQIFNTIFSACYFLKVQLHYFSKIISQKESQNSRIQDLSYFCRMIEGSGSRAGSGSIPLTSGSGSGRPKGTSIRWIRIRTTGFLTDLIDGCREMQASEEMRQQLLEETERVEEKLEQLMRSNREKEEKEAIIMHELNTLRLLPLISHKPSVATPAANLPPVANNGINIRLQTS